MNHYYECRLKHNGGHIFVARFQSERAAVNFMMRNNKMILVEAKKHKQETPAGGGDE